MRLFFSLRKVTCVVWGNHYMLANISIFHATENNFRIQLPRENWKQLIFNKKLVCQQHPFCFFSFKGMQVISFQELRVKLLWWANFTLTFLKLTHRYGERKTIKYKRIQQNKIIRGKVNCVKMSKTILLFCNDRLLVFSFSSFVNPLNKIYNTWSIFFPEGKALFCQEISI